jgi:hypothetical protein
MSRFSWSSFFLTGAAIAVGPLAVTLASNASAAPSSRVADPVSHSNLSVYFLRGTSAPGPVPLTLAEALVKGTVVVDETGNVNELQVENKGTEDVFVQAGDIVKGGQQDRVLTVSLLLPAKSGRLPIGAFCVEQGRWSARGKEDVKRFATSVNSVPSREAKLAMLAPAKPKAEAAPQPVGGDNAGNTGRTQRQGLGQSEVGSRQGEVWANVGKIQEKLSSNLKSKVASGTSASSLQLSLENETLAAARSTYISALSAAPRDSGEIVGVAFAINGRISSAEVYPSAGLFQKMWPKLLDAAATEAIAEAGAKSEQQPAAEAVAKFLETTDAGNAATDVQVAPGLARRTMDAPSALAIATKRADGLEVHRTYLAK